MCDASHLIWNNPHVPAVGCRTTTPGAQLVLFPRAPSRSHTSFLKPQDLCTLHSLSARYALPRIPYGSLFHFLLTKIWETAESDVLKFLNRGMTGSNLPIRIMILPTAGELPRKCPWEEATFILLSRKDEGLNPHRGTTSAAGGAFWLSSCCSSRTY